ncbi:unnamed protein product [Closterium sp. NIES-54]
MPVDLIKRAFLMRGISNELDSNEDGLAMVHRRSELTAEVDVDDEIIADGFRALQCRDFHCHGCLPFLAIGARQGLANGGRFLGRGVANNDSEYEDAETIFVGLFVVEAIIVVKVGYFDDVVVTVVVEAEGVLRVLPFDPEGRPVAFDTWHDNLQLYLLSDSRDSVSLFDHVSGVAPAPPATADVSTRSQWLSRDATARLAIRNHLPATECAHFGEHRTAQALYDAVVARYSSPATAAIGRQLLPYLFPELSAFATVADLISHLRTSDARYRATIPAEFLPTNQPPMFITLYFIVTRLPDSLRSVRDHFLTLDPTSLTVDLLEQHLLAAETSAVAVGTARGTPRSPFFEGCSPSPLSSSFASAATADVSVPEDVSAASTSTASTARARVAGVVEEAAVVVEVAVGVVVGAAAEGAEAVEVVAVVGPVAEVEALVAAVEAAEGVAAVEAVGPVVVGLDLSVEALVVVGVSSSSVGARLRRPSRSVSGWFSVGRVRVVRPARMSIAQRPRWAELLRSGVAIFDLDFDVIFYAMYLAEALHTFTLDSGASRCFFRDSTNLTPLLAPVPVRLADPSGGPVLASSSTVLPCLAVSSGSLSGLHLPSFSTNLVSTAALQDAMVTTTTPGGQPVSICTCTRTGRHLATFTRRPGSSLYTLATEPPQVAASAQTLLWHHRLGHPSLQRLRGMHSRLLVSGLPRSLPPLPPSPAPPCLPYIEGRQRATPHSSSFPPTTAPQQTLNMDVGGEFSSDLLRDFCRVEGILQSFTLPDSPQQNGFAECRIGLVMEVARTSKIHAAAPHFLWPFAVRYAAHQLNLWPRVSLPETSPTLHWTEKVGDASVFQIWGSRAFVRDTSADKLSARAIPCVFLGFVPNAPGWQFYLPTLRNVLPSQDVTFDESVPFYRLFPYRSASSPPPLLSLAPSPPPPGGAGSEGAGSGGAEPEGVEPGGAESKGAESGGAESEGEESWGAEPRGAASSGGPAGASPQLSSQQLREWLVQRPHRRSGAPGAGEPGDAGAGAGVGGTGAGGAGAAGAGAVDPGAGGAGGTVRPRPYFVPLLQQILGVPSSTGLPPPFLCPPPDQSQLPLQPASPLPLPSRYTEQSGGLTEHREPLSCPVSLVHTARRTPRSRPPLVPGTHTMAVRPFSVPLRVPLPAPPESSLPEVPDPEFDQARAASPTVARLLATAAAMDAEMASWKSTGTYVDENPPPEMNIVDGMWIFRVKRPPGSPPAFKARYVARGFRLHLRLLGLFLLQQTRRCFYAPTPRCRPSTSSVLQRFGFQYSSPQLTPLSTSHSLSAPPSDESVEPTGPYPELVGCLIYLMTCTRPDLAYPLSLFARYVAPGRLGKVHWDAAKRVLRYLCSTSGMGLVLGGRGPVVLTGRADASWVDDSALQRSSQGYTFSLGSGSVSWRSTRSSSVLSSSCEADIYAGAMAAQELCWLTYLLTDLGEQPRLPPVLYVDNKAMIALC